jgi:hypothetical protein
MTLPRSDDYNLIIRQEPERAKVAGPKEKGMVHRQNTVTPALMKSPCYR